MSSKIRSYTLSLLARREHSKLELQQKLSKKEFAAGDIANTIRDLANQGLQSDDRFIEGYISMRSRRGFGPIRIRAELHERGIDKEKSEQFLDQNDPSWFELAQTVCYKKFGKTAPCELPEKMKQIKYLYYKGFTTDHIKRLFKYDNL